MVVLDDEEEVIDLTGAADGSLLAELLSAYDAANSQVAVKEEKGSHAAASSEPLHEVISLESDDDGLDICEHAVRQQGDKGQRAERALKERSRWQLTMPREYNKGRNELPHHVDGTGSWVVLFSFGLTVDFYVGHKTVCVESGDALIFNGSPSHGVVHGFTNPVRRNATYRGKSQPLVGMRIVDDKRMSVQARMS